MKYKVAEKFKSIQGEGVYAGTPMAFIRFVGCSVGKKICQHCDTDFDAMMPWRGGGEFDLTELLLEWARPYQHICLTGGEPLDQDIEYLAKFVAHSDYVPMLHVETSGTKALPDKARYFGILPTWVCVSPKPGFIEDVVLAADEVKVIVPGLGELTEQSRKTYWANRPAGTYNDEIRWPILTDALRWADAGKIVFLQPRNAKYDIDANNLRLVQDIIVDHPNLRLSVQMHKVLKVQ